MDKNCKNCIKSLFDRCETLNKNCDYDYGSTKYFAFLKKFVCDDFKNRNIEYPIEVSEIIINDKMSLLYKDKIGKFCRIRYCEDNKTYLGLFLGELPCGITITHNSDSKVLTTSYRNNPAIFVFELNKIVFGYESWWDFIENEEELREITDTEINNIWYVKALKQMGKD